ncbi:hypothetical protein, partial [Stenotrophomonas forensis]|uniref:hypothetical protein n=1 Tax=Stenotrophomonas forensis TaxID=2871169 RepID=UPI0039C71840
MSSQYASQASQRCIADIHGPQRSGSGGGQPWLAMLTSRVPTKVGTYQKRESPHVEPVRITGIWAMHRGYPRPAAIG